MEPRKLLLVEDNPDDVELTRHALSKNKLTLEMVVARDGQEALDLLFGSSDAGPGSTDLPALILLDLRLPKVDGLTVLKVLKENPATRRVPVVVLSTSREDRDVLAAYDLGANSYVRKPVDFDKFVEMVRLLEIYWLSLNEDPSISS
jgi:two-component system response regulator